MREIKFRAWDGEKMHYEGSVGFGGDVLVSSNYRSDKIYSVSTMQYTGLKDKNGKEIYDGDLFNDTDRIIYCATCLGWQVGWELKGAVICHNCDGDYSLHECVEEGTVDEGLLGTVIGNIYENPELLNQKKV